MTNLIRQKHKFTYHGQQFFCFDLTVGDYILLSIDPQAGFEKIIFECNEKAPTLNPRQYNEFMRILSGGEEEKKEVIEVITETQKKIQEFKNKNKTKQKEKTIDELMQDFHIIEGQMMHFLNQSLSEIRSWPYQYFMQLYKDLAYCTGAKEYEKNRSSKAPDRKGFKEEFPGSYSRKR